LDAKIFIVRHPTPWSPERIPSPTRSKTSYSGCAESPDKLYSLFEDLTSLEIAFSKPTEHSESASFWLMVGISLFVSLLLGHLGEGTFNRLLSCSSVDAAGHRHMKFLIHDWMIFLVVPLMLLRISSSVLLQLSDPSRSRTRPSPCSQLSGLPLASLPACHSFRLSLQNVSCLLSPALSQDHPVRCRRPFLFSLCALVPLAMPHRAFPHLHLLRHQFRTSLRVLLLFVPLHHFPLVALRIVQHALCASSIHLRRMID
jgi:hypothetical protein